MKQKKLFKAVELKYLDENTINKIREWRNQDFVRKQSLNQHIITQQEHKNFIEKLKQEPNRGLFVFYLDDEPFAVFHYVLNSETNSLTGSSYLTDENYRYLGYGEVLHFFSKYIIFNILKADYELSEILDTNKKILASCKKGNLISGVLKNHIMIDNEYHDVYQIKYTKEYFENLPNRYKKLIYFMVEEESLENCIIY